MKVRYPAYYEKFSCIAGACEDTCCAGWEIDIDEASYEYYRNLPGEFGDKVRACIKQYEPREDVYESHGFILKEKRRCPFLQDDGLCEMILTLGEDAICDVCTYTPRNFLEYGGMREISISPSCAEAGRLIFGSEEPVAFVDGEEPGELDIDEGEEEFCFGERIRCARDYAIAILQDRQYLMSERMAGFLCYAKEVQEGLNREDFEAVDRLRDKPVSGYIERGKGLLEKEGDFTSSSYLYFLKRLAAYSSLDSIDDEWAQYLRDMNEVFIEGEQGEKKYIDALGGYVSRIQEEERAYEWEQMAVYLCFLMVSRCVDDWNFWGKAQFVAVSWLFVRDMDALRYEKRGSYTREDRVDVMRIYAKEVEHSQDNLDCLEEEFLFGEEYRLEELLKQI